MPTQNPLANNGEKTGKELATAVAKHVKDLLLNPRPPELPEQLSGIEDLSTVHDYLMEVRQQLRDYSRGDFSADIQLRGMLAGTLKSIQSNMRHLIWQMRQVKSGNFTQRIDYMGEFSEAFNLMVKQLQDALSALKEKEEELVRLTKELEEEVEKRGAALTALQKSEESLKYLAEHDPLTGLLNRRSFFAQAEMEMTKISITQSNFCIALMDVDHFKRVNDTYGHPNGDIALRHIAKIGHSALRHADIMGRYGGEEFIFFFADADRDHGLLVAERIRAIIMGNPITLSDQTVHLAASFGMVSVSSSFQANAISSVLERAVSLADAALYKAKFEGRNRVSVVEYSAE